MKSFMKSQELEGDVLKPFSPTPLPGAGDQYRIIHTLLPPSHRSHGWAGFQMSSQHDGDIISRSFYWAFSSEAPSSVQAAMTKYHRGAVFSHGKLVSHGSEGWKSGLECQHGWVLMRTFWWVSDKLLLTVSSRGSQTVRGLCCKEGFQSRSWGPHPQDLLKSAPPNTITIRAGFQHVNFERTHVLSPQQREHMKERNTGGKNRGKEKEETEPGACSLSPPRLMAQLPTLLFAFLPSRSLAFTQTERG